MLACDPTARRSFLHQTRSSALDGVLRFQLYFLCRMGLFSNGAKGLGYRQEKWLALRINIIRLVLHLVKDSTTFVSQ